MFKFTTTFGDANGVFTINPSVPGHRGVMRLTFETPADQTTEDALVKSITVVNAINGGATAGYSTVLSTVEGSVDETIVAADQLIDTLNNLMNYYITNP